MFMPGLACAEIMKAQKPHMAMAKDMPCCPKAPQKSDMGGMLFKDCMKIDLQHAINAPLLKKIDSAKILPYILPQVTANDFGLSQARLIRGPPDPPEIVRLSSLPVFLATQRLRI